MLPVPMLRGNVVVDSPQGRAYESTTQPAFVCYRRLYTGRLVSSNAAHGCLEVHTIEAVRVP